MTTFHAINNGLRLPLPLSNDVDEQNPHAESLQLIWGAGGSVGQHAIQILQYYGFKNRFAVSSKKNNAFLRSIGATHVFDQSDPNLIRRLYEATLTLNHGSCPPGRFIVDFLASQKNSIGPIAALSNPGARVAVWVPVIGDQKRGSQERELFLDPLLTTHWRGGVAVNAFRPEMHNYVSIDSLYRGQVTCL